ncbi:UNVERIFIED_CONTAM: hypothetical protein ABID98_000951 [Brevibacillus sp. OAP136]
MKYRKRNADGSMGEFVLTPAGEEEQGWRNQASTLSAKNSGEIEFALDYQNKDQAISKNKKTSK